MMLCFNRSGCCTLIHFLPISSQLQLPYDDMSSSLSVRTPLRENVIVRRESRNCPLKIAEAELRVNLVMMPIQDFDLILGMDWLTEHQVRMNCITREVMVDSPRQLSIRFHGEKQGLACCLVSALKATRLL